MKARLAQNATAHQPPVSLHWQLNTSISSFLFFSVLSWTDSKMLYTKKSCTALPVLLLYILYTYILYICATCCYSALLNILQVSTAKNERSCPFFTLDSPCSVSSSFLDFLKSSCFACCWQLNHWEVQNQKSRGNAQCVLRSKYKSFKNAKKKEQ